VACDSDTVAQVAASDDESRNFPIQNTSSLETKMWDWCNNDSYCEVREKTNKMQQLDVYYQQFLNMFWTS